MRLYAIMDRKTGEVVRDKTYVKLSSAKLALRYHYGTRTEKYGIGYVERAIKLAWIIDDNDEWTEVFE
ncbi:hypothetical protein M6D81_11465 [Paenibacillus sp. J5C_2022]|uniref:hypothetical protein n=1 Tax=Paenibacillus sp. J5C2022 TaxID=2977129 RepID=UPI0021D1A8FA|nr:hypothetical protein [Paenibacillus sp. J5C2022]MCU6709325.1 hypothetical protein [Paenibacillus sp. J5C2022]